MPIFHCNSQAFQNMFFLKIFQKQKNINDESNSDTDIPEETHSENLYGVFVFNNLKIHYLQSLFQLRNCFKDGKRKVDFVLVYSKEIFKNEIKAKQLDTFVTALTEKGLQSEIGYASVCIVKNEYLNITFK